MSTATERDDDDDVVEAAPLATMEDDVPSSVAFGNTLQTLRKRTGIKSSSIEKNEAAASVGMVVSPVDDEKKLTNDKLVDSSGQDDHDRSHVDREIMKSKCPQSNSIVTSKLTSTNHKKNKSETAPRYEVVSKSIESYPGCETD